MSYAEAVKQVAKCGEEGEGGGPSIVNCRTDDSVVVSRFNFLAFIVEGLCVVKQSKNNSDVVRSVMQAAERVLGIGGIELSVLHSHVFSRDNRARYNGDRLEDDGDAQALSIVLYPSVECWEFDSKWARV